MLLVFLISLFLNLEHIATKQAKDYTVGNTGRAFPGQMRHWAFLFHGQMCTPRVTEDRPLSGCREGYTSVPLANAHVPHAHLADSSRAQAETPPSSPPN